MINNLKFWKDPRVNFFIKEENINYLLQYMNYVEILYNYF